MSLIYYPQPCRPGRPGVPYPHRQGRVHRADAAHLRQIGNVRIAEKAKACECGSTGEPCSSAWTRPAASSAMPPTA
ncbi:hypothetical protein P4234_15045 [Pseudomonas aeruginosa]|nr:hypothetical protein [Pseudomonas aeruginosa]